MYPRLLWLLSCSEQPQTTGTGSLYASTPLPKVSPEDQCQTQNIKCLCCPRVVLIYKRIKEKNIKEKYVLIIHTGQPWSSLAIGLEECHGSLQTKLFCIYKINMYFTYKSESMRLFVVELGSSHCSGFCFFFLAEEQVDVLTSSLLSMQSKSGQGQISPLIWSFVTLKVYNSAHWILQLYSGSELFYPAEHFPCFLYWPRILQ